MPNGRKRPPARIALAAAGAVTASLVPGLVHADPGSLPEVRQRIAAVQRRVDALYHRAERAAERANQVREDIGDTRERLGSVRADVTRQRRVVITLRRQAGALAVDSYQSAGLGPTGSLLVADNPVEFLSQLSTIDAFRARQGDLLQQLETETKRLRERRLVVAAELAELAEARRVLARERQRIDRHADAAEALLNRLNAREQELVERRQERIARRQARLAALAEARTERATRDAVRDEPTPTTTVATSDRAAIAVDFALAQVGDAYVYGGAGPDAYDCSGLTMAAWGAAGVSLPHSASAQAAMGIPVSVDSLMPGDLVFYYSPVSHAAIYVGNGQIVHAANPSDPVYVTSVFSMPIAGAVRPG